MQIWRRLPQQTSMILFLNLNKILLIHKSIRCKRQLMRLLFVLQLDLFDTCYRRLNQILWLKKDYCQIITSDLLLTFSTICLYSTIFSSDLFIFMCFIALCVPISRKQDHFLRQTALLIVSLVTTLIWESVTAVHHKFSCYFYYMGCYSSIFLFSYNYIIFARKGSDLMLYLYFLYYIFDQDHCVSHEISLFYFRWGLKRFK